MRESVNAAIIKNNELLLVRKRQSWILPGGKPKQNESDLECLCREVKEELSGTKIKNLRYQGKFEGYTHKGEEFRIKLYLVDVNGRINDPSCEIEESRWVKDLEIYEFSDVYLKVIKFIKKNYLNNTKDFK